MLTYAIIGLVVIATIAFMVWGDDGPLWKNFVAQAGVCLAIACVIGVIVWVGEYGT